MKLADEFLVAAGALSLTEMRSRVWRVIPKGLERGTIRPSARRPPGAAMARPHRRDDRLTPRA